MWVALRPVHGAASWRQRARGVGCSGSQGPAAASRARRRGGGGSRRRVPLAERRGARVARDSDHALFALPAQLRKKLEQVEREHKDLKRAYFQLSLRQRNQGNEKDGAQVTASEQRGRASGAGLAPHGGAQCARAGGCVARG